jgi:PKHD-type hydroxylase
VFPSFRLHRVTPVTSGVRKTLVVWSTGPAFR